MSILNKVFGSYSEREVKKINKTVKHINSLEPAISKLSDEELKNKTASLKDKLNNGETLEDILPEAFAVCREASKRFINIRHYDVQLVGGIVLHQGRIAEMKTGEGKTFVGLLPAYLNALTGEGVHIITVNDYLAERDCDINRPVFEGLGLTVNYVLTHSSKSDRKSAYNCDVTYLTNNELGFDYLRDNMVNNLSDKVQRKLVFGIIDEVDSILIDEARTPLIISGAGSEATDLYKIVDLFVKTLKGEDYKKDDKSGAVFLTDKGIFKAESFFNLKNYADIEHNNVRHHISQSLRANYHMTKDKDYLIKSGEILIIDEFTGRIAEGRRYSNGLHQAIESKECVEVKPENDTLATITYQNLFRLYTKISGMTGTGKTEEEEFRETYNLDVIEIPTNKPVIRKDNLDKVFITEESKINAILKDISRNYEKGRPVLVGTASIEKSELISNKLTELNIPHNVLNAKFHETEAEIISKAGEKEAVTVATNMAGRGTDIKLSDEVVALGGLKIIGTQRHESRRIDNQLRGRAGRQGDPGTSQFYISFEDDLMKIYTTDKIKTVVADMNKDDDKPIKNKFLTSAIERAQKNIEGINFSTRKDTVQYDEVINEQRKIIYNQRNEVLEGINYDEQVTNIVETLFKELQENTLIPGNDFTDEELLEFIKDINSEFFPHNNINIDIADLNVDKLNNDLYNHAKLIIGEKKALTLEHYEDIIKSILLKAVDTNWINHIEEMNWLRKEVAYVGMKGQNPMQIYMIEGAGLFQELITQIKKETIKGIINLTLIEQPVIQSFEELNSNKVENEYKDDEERISIEFNGITYES